MLLRYTNSDITCSHHHLTICAIIQIVTPKQGHAPQPQGETRPCHMSLPAVVPATMVAATGDCRLLTLDINLNRIPSRAMANRMRGRGNMQPKRLGRRGFMVKFVGNKTWGHLQDWERITRQSLIYWMTIIRETCMEKKNKHRTIWSAKLGCVHTCSFLKFWTDLWLSAFRNVVNNVGSWATRLKLWLVLALQQEGHRFDGSVFGFTVWSFYDLCVSDITQLC